MRIGLYPGSFDPITNGHIDIINRSLKMFDKVYICVAINPNKKNLFTDDEKDSYKYEIFNIYIAEVRFSLSFPSEIIYKSFNILYEKFFIARYDVVVVVVCHTSPMLIILLYFIFLLLSSIEI